MPLSTNPSPRLNPPRLRLKLPKKAKNPLRKRWKKKSKYKPTNHLTDILFII